MAESKFRFSDKPVGEPVLQSREEQQRAFDEMCTEMERIAEEQKPQLQDAPIGSPALQSTQEQQRALQEACAVVDEVIANGEEQDK